MGRRGKADQGVDPGDLRGAANAYPAEERPEALIGAQVKTVRACAKLHCPHRLTKTRDGKTTHHPHVLETKLFTPSGFAFSLMTEFIENPGPQT